MDYFLPTEYLSPSEFESFANKLVGILTNKKIQDLPEGPDGGIDGLDDSVNPTIIVQAKRFRSFRSTTENCNKILVEIDKINELVATNNWPNVEYYIVTSGELTITGITKIRKKAGGLFKHGDDNVISKTRLKELRDDERIQTLLEEFHLRPDDIVKQLSDRVDQVISIQTQNFLSSVNLQFFVPTHVFAEAYGTLIDNQVVLIHGLPGVGKTTSSVFLVKMLYSKLNQEYGDDITSVLECDIGEARDVKRRYQADFDGSNKRLIVIFDDFLGRSELTTDDVQRSAITDLIGIAQYTKQLYLILNTRSQILNEAKVEDLLFSEFVDKLSKRRIQLSVDMTDITNIERASMTRLAFERAYHEAVGAEKSILADGYESIRIRDNYTQIIGHRNFNPRLIELITNHFGEQSSQITLSDYALQSLDQPTRLYDELFYKLTTDQRRYLFLATSFGENQLGFKDFQIALCELDFNIDADFQQLKRQLIGAWLQSKSTDAVHEYLDFINPSVYDYLVAKQTDLPLLKDEILNSSIFLSQLEDTSRLDLAVEQNFVHYHDRNNYLDLRIKCLLEQPLTDQVKSELTECVNSYGVVDEQMFFRVPRRPAWKTLFDLLDAAQPEAKCFVSEHLFLDREAGDALRRMDEQLTDNEIDGVVTDLRSIFHDVFREEFEQDETIDMIEEATQVNLYSVLTNHKSTQIQNTLDDLASSYYGDIYNNIDPFEYGDDSKTALIDELRSKALSDVADMIDSSILEGNAEPDDFDFDIFNEQLDDEIDDARYNIREEERADRLYDDLEDPHEQEQTDYDEIDEILNQPLD